MYTISNDDVFNLDESISLSKEELRRRRTLGGIILLCFWVFLIEALICLKCGYDRTVKKSSQRYLRRKKS